MSQKPVLSVTNLAKTFVARRGFLNPVSLNVRAVDDVSFNIQSGEAFGLVGESGCGKTTVGRCVLRLIEPDAGSLRLHGEEISAVPTSDRKSVV